MRDIITRATHPTPCSRCPARRELEAELARARARIEKLEAALEEAVHRIGSGRLGTIGASQVRTAQVDVKALERWTTVLREFPAPVQADTEETGG